jgi:hypothetical protein
LIGSEKAYGDNVPNWKMARLWSSGPFQGIQVHRRFLWGEKEDSVLIDRKTTH